MTAAFISFEFTQQCVPNWRNSRVRLTQIHFELWPKWPELKLITNDLAANKIAQAHTTNSVDCVY